MQWIFLFLLSFNYVVSSLSAMFFFNICCTMDPHQAIERIKPCFCVISDGKQQSSNVFTYRDVWMSLITTHFFSQ